jgi:hypothetical protein
MRGEIARSRAPVLITKVTLAGDAAAARLGPGVALPVGRQMRVPVAVTALTAANAENRRTHERPREPTVPTTYLFVAHLAGTLGDGQRAR